MKRQPKRKMAPACHSPPRRICFNAITLIEIRKPGRIWAELFANRSCSGRLDGTSMSLETILEACSSPPALLLWQSPRRKLQQLHSAPSMKSCNPQQLNTMHWVGGILNNIRPLTEAKVKTQKPRKNEAKYLL